MSQIVFGFVRLLHNIGNYLYLSHELAIQKNDDRKAKLLEAVENGSVVTWAHFNLHGEFDFSDEKMQDSVGLLLPKNSLSKTI